MSGCDTVARPWVWPALSPLRASGSSRVSRACCHCRRSAVNDVHVGMTRAPPCASTCRMPSASSASLFLDFARYSCLAPGVSTAAIWAISIRALSWFWCTAARPPTRVFCRSTTASAWRSRLAVDCRATPPMTAATAPTVPQASRILVRTPRSTRTSRRVRRGPSVPSVAGEVRDIVVLPWGSDRDGAVNVEGEQQPPGQLVGAEEKLAGRARQRVRRLLEGFGVDVDHGADRVDQQAHRLAADPNDHDHGLLAVRPRRQAQLLAEVDGREHLAPQV